MYKLVNRSIHLFSVMIMAVMVAGIFSLAPAVASSSSSSSSTSSSDDDGGHGQFCVEPEGEVEATIASLEEDGWTLVSIDCQPVLYFVEPTPPYVDQILTVVLRRIQCPDDGGPCISFGRATFTADLVVINEDGDTEQTNVSPVFIAL